MSSTVSSTPDSTIAAALAQPSAGRSSPGAGRPSYESFLRIKQGIGSEALRAAGLPAAENLSYDAYVAALNRKAAEMRAAEPMPAAEPRAPADRADAKRIAWASLVVVPVAVVFVLLVADMFKDRPDLPNGSEAVAAPLTGDGLPVALVITAMDETTSLVQSPIDDAASAPMARFDNEVVALAPVPGQVEPEQPVSEKVALLPAASPAAEPASASILPKKKPAAAEANVVPLSERRVAAAKPAKTTSKPARQSAKKQDDFWQPLVDLLDGKGVRGARNVPAPEDRAGK